MKVESHPDVVEHGVRTGFETALTAAVEMGRQVAPKRTGKYAGSIKTAPVHDDGHGLHSAIGATVSSARAKELGAYITPKRAPRLVFNAGQGVRTADAVRLPPRPVIAKVVRRWPELMAAALRRTLRQ